MKNKKLPPNLIEEMELTLCCVAAEGWQTSPIVDHEDFVFLQTRARETLIKIHEFRNDKKFAVKRRLTLNK